jgi:haloacetate dehalogenase
LGAHDFFPGFEHHTLDVTGARINLRRGGKGPPLLLLHGYPETHIMWRGISERLSKDFTLILPDLRGYGDSSKPEGDDKHLMYSKREMAFDQVEVMAKLGYDSFDVAAHDRGARVAHRMALDHPGKVNRLALLDIIPTREFYLDVDKLAATAYYHWFFLIQKRDLPERLIGGDPRYFFTKFFDSAAAGRPDEIFGEDALEEYIRCFSDVESIHATCEDYRAGASIDLKHDSADLNKKISCPTFILWGERGLVGLRYDVMKIWRDRAADVTGQSIEGVGHFLAEEAPSATADALSTFFSQA